MRRCFAWALAQGIAIAASAQSVDTTTNLTITGMSTSNAAVDPTGPMRLAVDPGLCGMVLPVHSGMPPGDPVSVQQGIPLSAADKQYFVDEQLRQQQSQFCRPVLDPALAARARAALPAGCNQPPEAAALVNPDHPLADHSRPDVIAAIEQYQAALERVRLLREQCRAAATGRQAVTDPAMTTPPDPMLNLQ